MTDNRLYFYERLDNGKRALSGCPNCGCEHFEEWAPCYSLFDIYTDEVEGTQVPVHSGSYTDSDTGEIHCRSCNLAVTLPDDAELEYV